ncbi:MAG: AMP-binding protein [Deltaproteobacteria bacterium]|nr:AMP-binding protein [Deltaproteobacteria bacterium]
MAKTDQVKVQNEAEFEIPDVTIAQYLEQGFKEFPDRAAYHFMGLTHTYQELDEMSARFANFLQGIGCKQGDVVGIHLPNVPQALISIFGAFRAGCKITGISPLLTPNEITHQLNDSGASVLVTMDALYENTYMPAKDKTPGIKHIVVTGIADMLPALKRFLGKALKKIPTGKIDPIPGKETLFFMDILKKFPAECPEFRCDQNESCVLVYTGGTTGPSKGCEITHLNLLAECVAPQHAFDLKKGEEVFCSAFPFFHVAGLALGISTASAGYTQILVPDPRNTKYLCDSIGKYKPTFIAMVPTLYQMLLDVPAFKELNIKSFPGFKVCISGAAPFAEEPFRAMEAIVGEGNLIEAYGSSETCSSLTVNPLDGIKKIGSVGLPMPGNRVKIVDLDTGTEEMPVGEEGEVIAQGVKIMKGYLNKPDETANAIREFQGGKWFYTGDVGKLDEDGYLYIVDRTKDMISVGGYKVFSLMVEEVLYQHPAVDMCAIVGIPNPERTGDEKVKAVIQLTSEFKDQDPGKLQEELTGFCREQLAPYKVPKLFEFTGSIPVTAVGKVDKKQLR